DQSPGPEMRESGVLTGERSARQPGGVPQQRLERGVGAPAVEDALGTAPAEPLRRMHSHDTCSAPDGAQVSHPDQKSRRNSRTSARGPAPAGTAGDPAVRT